MRTPVPNTDSDKPADTITMDPVEAPAFEVEEPLPPALETSPAERYAEATPQDHNASVAFAAYESAGATVESAAIQVDAIEEAVVSRSNLPLPTGILRRPAIAAGWQPVAAKRPQPMKGSGLFRYAPGKLPVPAKPPRPELRPEQRLQPAAGPAR
jgi:hypothetical protein